MKTYIASLIAGSFLVVLASCVNNTPPVHALNTVTVAVNFSNDCPTSVTPPLTVACPPGSGYDATAVCITPAPSGHRIAVDWILGSGVQPGDDFKVKFANKKKACGTENDPNPDKECKIKEHGKYNYGDDDSLAFKYAVIGNGPGTCTLDPFIIIMK